MRNKLPIIVILVFAFFSVNGVHAQVESGCISLETYAEIQRKAPERLIIEVQNVSVERQTLRLAVPIRNTPQTREWDDVYITARVLKVKRSKSGLQKDQIIKINYTTNYNPPSLANLYDPRANWEWFDVNVTPLEIGKTYPAFLRKHEQSAENIEKGGVLYAPIAYSKSFEEVKSVNTNTQAKAIRCAEQMIASTGRSAQTKLTADTRAEEFTQLLKSNKPIILSTPDKMSEIADSKMRGKFQKYRLAANLIYILLDVKTKDAGKAVAILYNPWETKYAEVPVEEARELFKYVTVEGDNQNKLTLFCKKCSYTHQTKKTTAIVIFQLLTQRVLRK